MKTLSNRPDINTGVKVRYRGLLVSMIPCVNFIKTVNKAYYRAGIINYGEYKYFPVRTLIAFDKEYNQVTKNWEKIYNPNSADKINKDRYFFEHVWGVQPESVKINDRSGMSLNELIALTDDNYKKGLSNLIQKCTLDTGVDLEYSVKEGNKIISLIEIEGLGPLYPRIHKVSKKPFTGRGGSHDGEILLHLDSPTISTF